MAHEDYMYDFALREWLVDGLAVERENSPVVYYHEGLNQFRLDRFLITLDQLAEYTEGGYVLAEHESGPDWKVLGQIVACKTEEAPFRKEETCRPGYWIVEKDDEIFLFLGSNTRKPIKVEINED